MGIVTGVNSACYVLTIANISSAQLAFNYVSKHTNLVEQDKGYTEEVTGTHKLFMSKLVAGLGLGLILYTTNTIPALKNKFSPLVMAAPTAITMGTFAVSQIAQKMGKYQEALATFDKISDRIVEVAFSVASIYCLTLYVCLFNRNVSQVKQALTVLSLAASALAIVYKIVRVAYSYGVSPPPAEKLLPSSLKTPSIPAFDIKTLGLDINETTTIAAKVITMEEAIHDIIRGINGSIKSTNDSRETKDYTKSFEFTFRPLPWSRYSKCATGQTSPPNNFKDSWLMRIISALIAKGYVTEMTPLEEEHLNKPLFRITIA